MALRKVLVLTNRGLYSRAWDRCLSSQIQTQQVDKNIRLHRMDSTTVRPLVLLFSWLLAKGKHLEKYREMYMNEGFDVKTIQVHVKQLLLPRETQTMTEKILDLLAADQSDRPLMVHGFSVGGYVFGEFLLKLVQNPEKYASIPPRLQGFIFDSIVDMNGIPIGVSRAATQNRAYQKLIHSVLDLYLKTPSVKHYNLSSATFKNNTFDIPALLMYSNSDPVVEPGKIEELVSSWRERGVNAHTKFWNDAPHVSLFMKHPEEYTQSVVDFIRQCGFQRNEEKSAGTIMVDNQEQQQHDREKMESRAG